MLVCAAITLAADTTFACSCGPVPPVLSAYEHAHAVVIARVVSIQVYKSFSLTQEKDRDKEDIGGFGRATVMVEKVYKGNLRVNGEITAGAPPNAACSWSFHEKSVGQQFLLYLYRVGETGSVWGASTCGRTRGLEYATEDLLYLDNMDRLRGKTRVSGNYRGALGVTLEEVANRTIRIKGEKKTYEIKTDANGVFEIYDLPAGNYIIEPEIPNGWQLARYISTTQLDLIPFTLEAKQHVSLNLPFEPSNAVEGRIVGPDGNPMKGVCVDLQKPDQVDGNVDSGCTDKNGHFRIRTVPAGSYVAVLNPDGKLSPDEPFPTIFYPSVAQREKAALITIGNGETVKGINFVVSSISEIVTLSGVLLFSDDKPVAGEDVEFIPLKKDDADQSDRTDTEGRFTIRILKGAKGEIFGEFYASLGDFDKCPKLDALIKASGEETAEIKTPTIKIDAEHDIENLVLQFPFPRCKRKE